MTEVVALEPDGALRRRLVPRLASAGVSSEVVGAGIDEAGFDDGSFDTIVSTLVLCTVPDIASAVRRIRRWLAADGQLLFLEPVRARRLAGLRPARRHAGVLVAGGRVSPGS